MLRKNGSRGFSSMLILLAVGSCLTESCKKHQSAPTPAPIPTAQRVPKPKRAHARTIQPPASPAPPNSPGPLGAGATAPQLGQIVSASDQRQYNLLIDQSLSQTQSSLDGLTNRKLTPEQEYSVRAIREFMQQANTARKVDLVSAKALADKAQVLARDLVRNAK